MRFVAVSAFAAMLAVSGCDQSETKPAEAATAPAPAAPVASAIGTTEADLLAGKPIRPDAPSKTWGFSLGSNFDISMDVTLQDGQPEFATLVAATDGEGAGFSLEMSSPLQFQLYAWTAEGNEASQPIPLTAGAKHKIRLKSDAAAALSLEIDGVVAWTSKAAPKPSAAPFRTGSAIFAAREPKWVIDELSVSGDITKK